MKERERKAKKHENAGGHILVPTHWQNSQLLCPAGDATQSTLRKTIHLDIKASTVTGKAGTGIFQVWEYKIVTVTCASPNKVTLCNTIQDFSDEN